MNGLLYVLPTHLNHHTHAHIQGITWPALYIRMVIFRHSGFLFGKIIAAIRIHKITMQKYLHHRLTV